MAFLESPGVKISEVDLSTTIPTEGCQTLHSWERDLHGGR